ncbi:MAG: hypothetical protein R3C03_04970 [Pirellulaceae bacterium]
MSVDPTSDTTRFRTDEVPLHQSTKKPSNEGSFDSDLVNQTKNQIRALVQEISDLAKSDCSEEEFYQGFLTRTTSALASVGGVIWTRPSTDSPLKLLYHINLKRTVLVDNPAAQIQHSLLLEQILESSTPTIIAPHSGEDEADKAGNPTDFLLLFAPLELDNETIGLVEILQRPGGGPATQRGYLRFLVQMAEIASDFLKTRRLRSFQTQQLLWQDLDQFTRSVHGSLDTDETAFVIANDGRRIVGCDRISVAIKTGPRMQVAAISGLDTIERRADQVKRLAQLAGTVVRTRESLWYSGDDSKLAPQIETQLHAYVDQSHSRQLGIIPLFRLNGTNGDAQNSEPLGALIIEQLSEANLGSTIVQRSEVVAEHAERALGNCLDHNNIFLMPLWKRLNWLSAPFRGTRFPKTATILASIALGIFALCVVPYSFELGGSGELIAEFQRDVFAQVDGKPVEVFEPASPEEIIPAGFVLVEMESYDLAVEIESITGELKQAQEQLTKLNRLQFQDQMEDFEKISIVGDILKAEKTIESLKHELQIKKQQAEQLTVRNPIEGRLANWQLRRNLLGRPVRQGQNLVTVISPTRIGNSRSWYPNAAWDT